MRVEHVGDVTLYCTDWKETCQSLEDHSVDAILTDLPYGTTACKWDTIIPFAPMWAEVKRVLKPRGVFVTTASQPFTSALVMSNISWFKYEWVWNKVTARGHLVAKKRPMAQHENICVFYENAPTYNPQMTLMTKPSRGKSVEASRTSIMGGKTTKESVDVIRTHNYPKTIISISTDGAYVHPTQKPVALYVYLVRTYTNPSDTVLDFCMGSGTTGVACMNTGRKFIGGDNNKEYFNIAVRRIIESQMQLRMLEVEK